MTREEIKNTPELVEFMLDESVIADSREKLRKRLDEVCNLATKALEQQPCDDMEEIREVMSCDADAETKCKMISNILTAKPHYFKEQEPCEDAISRQALQTELENCEVVNVRDENDNFIEYYNADTVDSILRNLPPVTPQQKIGRWILADEQNKEDIEINHENNWSMPLDEKREDK